MKVTLLAVMMLFFASFSFAQTTVFHENFELPSLGDSVTSSGLPVWSINTSLYSDGNRSIRDTVHVTDTAYLVTNSFSTLGSSIVTLSFAHICKLEHFDNGEIEVSVNGGTTWTKLTAAEYQGASQFVSMGNRFTATAYPIDWDPSNNNTIPTASWWKNETFNLNALAGNQANVKIRFKISNGPSGLPGSNGAYGWVIDNIKVTVPSAQEASLMSWKLPYSLPSGCGLTNETIQIKFKNNGGASIVGNLNASFQRIGTAAVTEVVPATILPGDSFTYTFTNKINLTPLGGDTTFNIKTWISLAGDPTLSNDTLTGSVQARIALSSPVISNVTIPYNTSTTLHAIHNDTVIWYSDILAQNMLLMSHYYTTPTLLDTTVYYVQARQGVPYQSLTLGTGVLTNTSTGYPTPYGNYYWGSKEQYLILASELTAAGVTAGNINSLSFDVNAVNSVPALNGFELKLGTTTQTALSAFTTTGLTSVYTNSAYQPVSGWNTHTFSTPFFWNGTSNIIVDVCFNNSSYLTAGNASVNQSTTSFASTVSYHTDAAGVCSGPGTPTTYTQRPNMKLVAGTASTSCPSVVVPVTVMLSGMPLNDAGVTHIVSPSGVLNAGTPYPVTVKIKNFGVDTLKKATINWSINGILKTPFLWTGSIARYNYSSNITLGMETFSSGVQKIKVWTSNPNDSLDWATMNDTINAQAFVCLSGTMTVGGASADFPDLQSVKSVLDTVGVCGPVVFNIYPGTYTGGISFGYINGSSGTNTITFQSSTGNNNDVIIQHTATSALNYVIRLNGADYFTFKNMTIKALDPTYGRVIEVINGADSNTFFGNKLISTAGTSSSCSPVYDGSTLNHYNSYINNYMYGGYYTMYMYGNSSTSWDRGTVIKGNELVASYYYPMYIYYQDGIQIINNYIHDGIAPYSYGISAYYINNGYKIAGNRVYLTATSSTACYGLRDYYGNYVTYNASPTAYGTVENNFVSIQGGTAAHYGLYAYYSNGTTYYHNSINIASGSTSSYVVYQANTATNLLGQIFKNNIFVNKAGGYAAYFVTPASITASDYNDYYTNGSNLVYWGAAYANLASLQASSGKDMNSKAVDPVFFSNTDLHLNNATLNNSGTYVGIQIDIDGEVRDTLTPDIGADEYNIITRDAAIMAMTSPVSSCPNTLANMAIQIKNMGIDSIKSYNIGWSVNGIAQTSFVGTDTILYGNFVNKIIGSYTFQANLSYAIKFWINTVNGLVDQKASNDTLFIPVFKTALPGGTYTIGGTGADFSTFNQALSALTVGGVCGPVVFNVTAGTYTEGLMIPQIAGASSINTITFQSATGVNTSVILQYTAASAADNAVVGLNGADYFSFKNMTLKALGTTYGNVIDIKNIAEYNSFEGNIIQTASTTSSSGNPVYNNTTNDRYNSFINNKMIGGYYGMYMYGVSSTSWEKGSRIINNDISGFYLYGIASYYQDSIQIVGNYIHGGMNTYHYGIYSYYNMNGYEIIKNKIVLNPTSYGYGLYDYYNNYFGSNASPSGFGLIANNYISISTGTGANYGLYAYYSNGSRYYYNTINIAAGSTSSYGIYQYNTTSNAQGQSFRNNIVVNKTGYYAAYYSTIASVMVCDYNDYFTTSATNFVYWGAAYANLTALQAASGKDQHSKSIDPLFLSATDFHTKNFLLNKTASPISGILTDIEGDLRDTLTPDMGCDEFTPPANEVSIVAMYTLGKLSKKASNPHRVMAIVENMGTNNQINYDINLSVTGANSFNFNYHYDTLFSGKRDTILFSPYTSLNFGVQTVKVSLPADFDSTNNVRVYRQEVTDTVFGFSDTSAVSNNLGYNTASGLLLAKFFVPGNRAISAVNAYITNSATVGKQVYGVVVNKSGVILDTSYTKTITASDVNTIVTFPLVNYFNTAINNDSIYVGIAQVANTVGFYPLGMQAENPARPSSFYGSAITGGAFTQYQQFGRPIIEAVTSDPLSMDVKAMSFVNPVSNCNLGSQSIKLKIKNVGVDTIFGSSTVLTVGYKLVGTAIPNLVETVTATIAPGQEYIHTFSTPLNMTSNLVDSTFKFLGFSTLLGDVFKTNDTTSMYQVVSKKTPLTPTASNISIPYATSGLLTGISLDTIAWYAYDTSTIILHTGANFNTPVLYDTTTYWAESTTKSTNTVIATIGNGVIANGTTSYPSPYGNFYWGSKDQYLILASELTALGYSAGNINSLAFDVSAVNTCPALQAFEIKMGHTTQSAMTTTLITSGLTSVYTNTSYQPVVGWNTHTFSTPFVWNGTSNVVIDVCFNNSSYLQNASVNQTATSFVSVVNYHTDASGVCASTTTGTTYSQRPNMKISALGIVDGCASSRIPVTVNITGTPAVDAGAVQIVNPGTSVQSNISTPIVVKVKNYGTNNLTSATIGYSVDGVIKPTYSLTGVSIPKDSVSLPITIALDTFAPGQHIIRAWTSTVNGAAGLYAINDTANSSFSACFAGVVTVGASGANYPTPFAAVAAIKNAGMCGSVIVDIQPGTYVGQLNLAGMSSMLSSNSLTFKSTTGNPNDVTIQYSAVSTTDNYVVNFDNTDHVIIRDITMKALNPTYGKVIELSNGSEYNYIYNNIITTPSSTSSYSVPFNSSSTGTDKYNVLRKNQIQNGYYGLYIYGNTATYERGWVIDSNNITGFYYYGIYASYIDSFNINANTIIGSNAGAASYGIYSYYNQVQGNITNNKVHLKTSSTVYGIYMYYNTFSGSTPCLVANNFISNENTSTTTYLLNAYYSNFVNYYNNNVVTNSGSSTGYCAYQVGGVGAKFVNNNFVNKAGGYAYYVGTPSGVSRSNYNNYFTTGASLGYWNSVVSNLAALKIASTQDTNSKSVDPMFATISNLHTNMIDLNATGFYFPEVSKDIDGETRSTSTPDIGADEFNPPADDAGVVKLVSPVSPATPTSTNVVINIRNFGTNVLTATTINWSVNGTLQAPYSWTGSILSNTVSGNITIGTVTLPLGLSIIKMWTSLPNGVADGSYINDTLISNIFTCTAPYSGTYTIGGTSANFPTINDALFALKYCTMSGPVTLNINPGTYNEQVVIGNIPGLSATNTLLLKSATGNVSDVILTYNANASLNYTLKLDSTKYVTIKGITIKATNATNGRVIEIAGGTKYCTLDSNKIETVYGTSSTVAGVYSYNSLDEFLTIKNNQILNGYYGVYLYGVSTASQERNNVIENNTISGFYYYGIYSYYQKNTAIRSNTITNGNPTGVAYGIYSYYNDSAIRFENNKVLLTTTSTSYGMYIYYNRAAAANRGRIANNFVATVGGTGTTYGIYNYYSDNQDYVYNSVNIAGGTSTAGRGMYMYYGTGSILRNNVVSAINGATGGYAIYVTPTTAISSSDYNCFYTSGTNVGYFGLNTSTLANWQTSSSMDANSVSINPSYLSNTNLHVSNVGLNGKATPYAGVTTDIDGQTRNTTNPDMGADEFDVFQWDAGIIGFNQPTVTYGPVGNAITVEVKFKNFGYDTITSMNLSYKVGTASPVVYPWTGSLLPGATASYTFTNTFNLALGQLDLRAYTGLASDQNLSNDTAKLMLTGMPLLNLAWSDNFDGSVNLWNANGLLNIWERGIPQKTTINSAHSAPNVWITDLNDQYLPNDTDYLYSPYFDFNGITGATLKFWHWYETQSGSDFCRIQYSTNLGQNWASLGFMSDPLATNWYNTNIAGQHVWSGTTNGWIQSTYDLSQFDNSSSPVQFRFQFVTNGSVNDDGWALDDFMITIPMAAVDASLDSILSPKNAMIFGTADSVKIRIKNNGSSTLTSIPVYYRINNGAPIMDLWTGSLATGATTTFTFATTITPPVGTSFDLCARVNAAGDAYPNNDSICQTLAINPPAWDAGVTQIMNPIGGTDTTCIGKKYQVKVTIKNFGTSTITSLNIQYTINTGTPVVETWTGSLASGATTTYSFTDSLIAQPGYYALCVKTNLPNDPISSNDQTCKNLSGHICIGMEDEWKSVFTLDQSIPNPTRGLTQIGFEIPKTSNLKFSLTNILGQDILSQTYEYSAGRHIINLNTESVPSGVYYYSIEVEGHKLTRKMIVVK